MSARRTARLLPNWTQRMWQMRIGRWWWTVVVIMVPVVVITAGAVILLLTFVDIVDTKDRIEILKMWFTIGAGTGGIVALILARRRQWSTEQAHQLAENTAGDVRHDATERRITDLYTKAVELLGGDSAAVRLGGLYALERLAQDNPRHRQTIINVVCAYLRLPYKVTIETQAPTGDYDYRTALGDADREQLQEREVRLAAQRVIADHMRPGTNQEAFLETYWEGIRLDLSRAHLIDFQLDHCKFGASIFKRAVFHGHTVFQETRFGDDANFKESTFVGSANFARATFNGMLFLTGSHWSGGEAVFHGAHFLKEAYFDQATFNDGFTEFDGATFDSNAIFSSADFETDATFRGATFSRQATFAGSNFKYPLCLDGATFSGSTSFVYVKFLSEVSFTGAQFPGGATPPELVEQCHKQKLEASDGSLD
ncbi:pentapeptide repeat-containing protein [Saccharothrix isguenensis]